MFCWHKWSLPISGTNQQVCTKCNKFTTIPCFHIWSDSVDNRQTCEKCGLVQNIPCNHVWEQIDISYVGGHKDAKGNITNYSYRKIRFKCKFCGIQRMQTV